MRTRKMRLGAALCGVFLCLVAGYVWSKPEVLASWTDGVSIDKTRLYKVAYVVDGDTFVADVDGHDATVRVLGINTPETVDPRRPVECYGPEASREAKHMLEARSVRLAANPD